MLKLKRELTERELEVVRQICDGKTLKEIATAAGEPVGAARSAYMRIRNTLGFGKTALLVRWAIRKRIIRA